MSRIDPAASMFLRSGCTIPTSAVEVPRASLWGHSVLHCSGCDYGTKEEQNVPNLPSCSDSWHGDGRDWSFGENPRVKQQPFFRNTLPPVDAPRSSSSSYLTSLNAQPLDAGTNRMPSLADCGNKALQFLGSFSGNIDCRMSSVQKNAEPDKTWSQYTQELIKALQIGGSRTKMEAAIAVRSLASSHNVHQVALIAAGGLRPLVDLLSYEAGETHWPPEMKEKATITVRAEAALALASLSVSNDENKAAIGAAGAIPRLCDLIQFDEDNDNTAETSYQKQEMAPFLVLARDAGAGALSCLAKNEANKEAMIAANAVTFLVRMVDQGTSFGRAAAANVLAKLATGDNTRNKIIIGKAGAIPALLRLIKQGSPKARETAAEALANLALIESNKLKILKEGGIDCLLKMMESCSQVEKDAAAAAVKVLQSVVGAGSKAEVLLDDRNWSTDDDNIKDGASKKASRRESDTTPYQQEKISNDSTGEVSASRHRGIMSMLHTNLNDLTPPLRSLQNVFTSELTSSLAPPLVGQPSIQADSLVGFSKESSYLTQSRKRMKLSHPPTYNICGSPVTKLPPLENESSRVGSHTLYEGDFAHRALTDDRNIPYSSAWGRVGFSSYQEHVFSNTDYTNGEPRQAAECLEVQHISGGILALVNALSSQNPGAQEYSALALMLLASQGGYGIKTAINDAGALPPLIVMISTSSSLTIRESAAAAVSKLVSCHPVNRVAFVRAGGLRALVEMAKWSAGLTDGGGSIAARTLAAAVVAVLSLSGVLDRSSMQLGLREALPALAHMLENDDMEEIKAGVGGLQALASALRIDVADSSVSEKGFEQEESIQVRKGEIIPLELVTSLLDLMRCNIAEAKEGAINSLASFRKVQSSAAVMNDGRKDGNKDEVVALRKEGLEVLLLLLARVPNSAALREIVAGTLAYVVASERLQCHITEASAVPHLMRLLLEGPTIATVVLAASAIANLGARKKCLESVSVEDIPLLLRLLTNGIDVMDGSRSNTPGFQGLFTRADNQLHSDFANSGCSPYLLIREHAAAILIYSALSGEKKKESLIAAGAAPVFVQLLQSCVTAAEMNTPSSVGNSGFFRNRRQVNSILPQATEEFAVMGLILLADKNEETVLKIVQAGGIPTLVKLLSMTGGRGRLGASWSEMAAAALLTLSGCDAARREITRVGGITSLVSVLKGDRGSSTFSVTGLAAMVQLLGVLAQNSAEAKIEMGKVGLVRCLVEILIGGGYLLWAGEVEGSSREGSGLVALAQEAAARALATVVLHCPANAEAAVEAGAIRPLVRMLGSPPERWSNETPPTEAQAAGETESGASSAETGVTNDCSAGKVHLSTRNSSSVASEEETVETNAGGPLAAMAALGNMISCFPRCGREVVDAGILSRLLNLLQHGKPNPHMKDTCLNGEQVGYSKVRESAALVLGLLAEGDAGVQEAISSANILSALMEFSTSRFNVPSASATGQTEKENEATNTGAKDDQTFPVSSQYLPYDVTLE